MSNDYLTKLGSLIDQKLKNFGGQVDQKFKDFGTDVDQKLKNVLEPIINRLDDPKTGLNRINKKLDALWDQTIRLTEDMEKDCHTSFSRSQ